MTTYKGNWKPNFNNKNKDKNRCLPIDGKHDVESYTQKSRYINQRPNDAISLLEHNPEKNPQTVEHFNHSTTSARNEIEDSNIKKKFKRKRKKKKKNWVEMTDANSCMESGTKNITPIEEKHLECTAHENPFADKMVHYTEYENVDHNHNSTNPQLNNIESSSSLNRKYYYRTNSGRNFEEIAKFNSYSIQGNREAKLENVKHYVDDNFKEGSSTLLADICSNHNAALLSRPVVGKPPIKDLQQPTEQDVSNTSHDGEKRKYAKMNMDESQKQLSTAVPQHAEFLFGQQSSNESLSSQSQKDKNGSHRMSLNNKYYPELNAHNNNTIYPVNTDNKIEQTYNSDKHNGYLEESMQNHSVSPISLEQLKPSDTLLLPSQTPLKGFLKPGSPLIQAKGESAPLHCFPELLKMLYKESRTQLKKLGDRYNIEDCNEKKREKRSEKKFSDSLNCISSIECLPLPLLGMNQEIVNTLKNSSRSATPEEYLSFSTSGMEVERLDTLSVTSDSVTQLFQSQSATFESAAECGDSLSLRPILPVESTSLQNETGDGKFGIMGIPPKVSEFCLEHKPSRFSTSNTTRENVQKSPRMSTESYEQEFSQFTALDQPADKVKTMLIEPVLEVQNALQERTKGANDKAQISLITSQSELEIEESLAITTQIASDNLAALPITSESETDIEEASEPTTNGTVKEREASPVIPDVSPEIKDSLPITTQITSDNLAALSITSESETDIEKALESKVDAIVKQHEALPEIPEVSPEIKNSLPITTQMTSDNLATLPITSESETDIEEASEATINGTVKEHEASPEISKVSPEIKDPLPITRQMTSDNLAALPITSESETDIEDASEATINGSVKEGEASPVIPEVSPEIKDSLPITIQMTNNNLAALPITSELETDIEEASEATINGTVKEHEASPEISKVSPEIKDPLPITRQMTSDNLAALPITSESETDIEDASEATINGSVKEGEASPVIPEVSPEIKDSLPITIQMTNNNLAALPITSELETDIEEASEATINGTVKEHEASPEISKVSPEIKDPLPITRQMTSDNLAALPITSELETDIEEASEATINGTVKEHEASPEISKVSPEIKDPLPITRQMTSDNLAALPITSESETDIEDASEATINGSVKEREASPVIPEVSPEIKDSLPITIQMANNNLAALPITSESETDIEKALESKVDAIGKQHGASPVIPEVSPEIKDPLPITRQMTSDNLAALPITSESETDIEKALESKVDAIGKQHGASPVIPEVSPEIKDPLPIARQMTSDNLAALPITSESETDIEDASEATINGTVKEHEAFPEIAEVSPEIKDSLPITIQMTNNILAALPITSESESDIEQGSDATKNDSVENVGSSPTTFKSASEVQDSFYQTAKITNDKTHTLFDLSKSVSHVNNISPVLMDKIVEMAAPTSITSTPLLQIETLPCFTEKEICLNFKVPYETIHNVRNIKCLEPNPSLSTIVPFKKNLHQLSIQNLLDVNIELNNNKHVKGDNCVTDHDILTDKKLELSTSRFESESEFFNKMSSTNQYMSSNASEKSYISEDVESNDNHSLLGSQTCTNVLTDTTFGCPVTSKKDSEKTHFSEESNMVESHLKEMIPSTTHLNSYKYNVYNTKDEKDLRVMTRNESILKDMSQPVNLLRMDCYTNSSNELLHATKLEQLLIEWVQMCCKFNDEIVQIKNELVLTKERSFNIILSKNKKIKQLKDELRYFRNELETSTVIVNTIEAKIKRIIQNQLYLKVNLVDNEVNQHDDMNLIEDNKVEQRQFNLPIVSNEENQESSFLLHEISDRTPQKKDLIDEDLVSNIELKDLSPKTNNIERLLESQIMNEVIEEVDQLINTTQGGVFEQELSIFNNNIAQDYIQLNSLPNNNRLSSCPFNTFKTDNSQAILNNHQQFEIFEKDLTHLIGCTQHQLNDIKKKELTMYPLLQIHSYPTIINSCYNNPIIQHSIQDIQDSFINTLKIEHATQIQRESGDKEQTDCVSNDLQIQLSPIIVEKKEQFLITHPLEIHHLMKEQAITQDMNTNLFLYKDDALDDKEPKMYQWNQQQQCISEIHHELIEIALQRIIDYWVRQKKIRTKQLNQFLQKKLIPNGIKLNPSCFQLPQTISWMNRFVLIATDMSISQRLHYLKRLVPSGKQVILAAMPSIDSVLYEDIKAWMSLAVHTHSGRYLFKDLRQITCIVDPNIRQYIQQLPDLKLNSQQTICLDENETIQSETTTKSNHGNHQFKPNNLRYLNPNELHPTKDIITHTIEYLALSMKEGIKTTIVLCCLFCRINSFEINSIHNNHVSPHSVKHHYNDLMYSPNKSQKSHHIEANMTNVNYNYSIQEDYDYQIRQTYILPSNFLQTETKLESDSIHSNSLSTHIIMNAIPIRRFLDLSHVMQQGAQLDIILDAGGAGLHVFNAAVKTPLSQTQQQLSALEKVSIATTQHAPLGGTVSIKMCAPPDLILGPNEGLFTTQSFGHRELNLSQYLEDVELACPSLKFRFCFD